MTILGVIRKKSLLARSARHNAVGGNIERPRYRSTGDPRLDLALSVERAAGR